MDMAVLVEAQGDLIDNIETQVWFSTQQPTCDSADLE